MTKATEISTIDVSDIVRAAVKCGIPQIRLTKKAFVVKSGPIYDALKYVKTKFNSDVYVEFGQGGWIYCNSIGSIDFSIEVLNRRILTKAAEEADKKGYGIYFIAE